MSAIIGLCTIEFYLPGFASLKEKRGLLKSMIKRMRNTFNVSAAETDHQDHLQSAGIAIVTVSSSSRHSHQVIQSIVEWIESNYPEAIITKQEMEIL